MNTTLCPDADALAALLETEGGEAPESAAHLETCPRCQQTLVDLAADHSTWEAMARSLPDKPPACEPALERAMLQLKNESPFTTITEPIHVERTQGTVLVRRLL